METTLSNFLDIFQTHFHPPTPYRGLRGTNWFVSRVWSDYMRAWLPRHYRVELEYSLNMGRRLDAALWCTTQGIAQCPKEMDIALEWEWDNNKVTNDFWHGDFRKLFGVDAHCGLAIVQTRVDGKRGLMQADEAVKKLHLLCKDYRQDNRHVALIEIRRVLHQKQKVEFVCHFQDLSNTTRYEFARWSYPACTKQPC